jgi:hypothetical protein
MKLNTFMTIASILAFIFGLALILVPKPFMGLYGVTLNDVGAQFLGRYLGSAFIGIAFLAWASRSGASKGVLAGFFVIALLGFVVALYDKFAGGSNALVWLNVVIYLLLGVGFGYFAFMKKV